MNKKKLLWIVASALVMVLAVFLMISWVMGQMAFSKMEGLNTAGRDGVYYSSDSVIYVPTRISGDGQNIYRLNNTLFYSENSYYLKTGGFPSITIADKVTDTVCTSWGIAWRNKDQEVFLYRNEKAEYVIDNVDQFCWDGENLVFLIQDTGELKSWNGGMITEITAMPEEADPTDRFQMVAGGGYIALLRNGGSESWLYRCSTDSWCMLPKQCSAGNEGKLVLLDHYLITINWVKANAIGVYDLITEEFRIIPLEIEGCHDGLFLLPVSTVVFNGDLWFSLLSEWTKDNEPECRGTYRLDTETWEAERIDREYYDVLYEKDGILWATNLLTTTALAEKETP